MTGDDGLRRLDVIRGISSRRVVRPDGVSPGTVLIAGERIEAVVPEQVTLPDVIDVGDLVVAPGLVDSHVHVNDPGRDWEGFDTATQGRRGGRRHHDRGHAAQQCAGDDDGGSARRQARGRRTAGATWTSGCGAASSRATPPI